MSTLNISLPKSLRKFVDEQVARGGYATASEYVRELIRRARKQTAREWLEGELLKGLHSGPGQEVTPEWWRQKRSELTRRLRRARKGA